MCVIEVTVGGGVVLECIKLRGGSNDLSFHLF